MMDKKVNIKEIRLLFECFFHKDFDFSTYIIDEKYKSYVNSFLCLNEEQNQDIVKYFGWVASNYISFYTDYDEFNICSDETFKVYLTSPYGELYEVYGGFVTSDVEIYMVNSVNESNSNYPRTMKDLFELIRERYETDTEKI